MKKDALVERKREGCHSLFEGELAREERSGHQESAMREYPYKMRDLHSVSRSSVTI